MKLFLTSLTCAALPFAAIADDQKFAKDRAAILSMAGAFEVEFNFTETVSLAEGYELKKP
ncbi:MAG: hypothetical protein PVJ98_07770 [Akkermansiaceae bacterium]|jgi:hypothetical protein